MLRRVFIPSVCTLLLVLATAPARAEVAIFGLSDELANNVRAHLPLVEEGCLIPRWRLQQRRKEARTLVDQALQAFGYYHATINEIFSETDTCWLLKITVDRGPRVHFGQIQIALIDTPIDLDSSVREIIEFPSIQHGDPLIHSVYDKYKASLLDAARAQGYWRARYHKAELAIYPAELNADVWLELELGPRYFFGDYEFSDSTLDQEFLRRLAGEVKGEPYSSDRLQQIYGRLQGSEYFQQVLLTPLVDTLGESTEVPLSVDLGMQSQTSFGAGIGYSTDQGPRVRADYRNRYYNRRGHKWRIDSLYSTTLKELGGTYTIPREDAAREWYDINSGWVQENNVSYESRTTTVHIRQVTALPSDWTLNTGVNVRHETYAIGTEPVDETLLVIPGIGISWLSVVNQVRQTHGMRVEVDLTASSGYWLSGTDYLQLRMKAKYILPIFDNGRLLLRGDVAGTIKSDFSELPPSVRFFTGGDNSIRGYEYNSLGTINAEGEVIGGSHLSVFSAEYDYLFLPSWSVSAFFDIGDAFDNTADFKRGAGLGIRWYSPIGPLRVDIATPLDGDDHTDKYRFHISVGADL